jgi:hypothetical protein
MLAEATDKTIMNGMRSADDEVNGLNRDKIANAIGTGT